MSALGNLVVSLSLEHAAFTQGLDKGSQEALKFAKNTQDAMDRMERSVQGFIGKVAGIGAAYLSLNSVYSSINKQVDALAQLDDAAQKTGASVELLSKIQKTAVAFGEDFGGKIEPAITKLARGIAGLEDPSNKVSQALKTLGLTTRDLNGQLKDPAQLTIEISKALQGYQDDATKAGIATDLFGKSGADLLPFLNDAAENVDKFSGATAEAAANAAGLQDSLNAQKQRFDDYVQNLTISVLPTLNDIAGAFLDIQTNGQALANDHSVTNWADNLALTVAPLYDTLVNLKNEVYAVGKSFQVALADVNLASARMQSLNPLAYLNGDPQKSLADAQAYRDRVLKEANSAYGDLIVRPRDGYEAALTNRIKNRSGYKPSERRSADKYSLETPAIIDSDWMNSEQEKFDKAKQSRIDASKKIADDAKKAYDNLTASINKQIEAKRQEQSINAPLSESQKQLLDINAQRVSGQLKLTDAQFANVHGLLQMLDVESRNLEMANLRKQSEQEYLVLAEQATTSRNEIYTGMLDETTALEELAQAKVDELNQMQLTKAEIDALNVARFDEQIGILETQKAYLASQPERENEIELIERQIEALKTLRGTVGQAEAINKSKAETDAMFGSMENAARMVWTVFANSGEDAAKAAGRAIKASILDLLYQMTIKKFFIQVAASVSPASTASSLAGGFMPSNPNASIVDQITESFKSINATFSSSIEKLGVFLSNGQGGLADKIGGFLGQYSGQIADGIGYLGAAYMLSQGNVVGAGLTAVGTYFGGPIGGAIGSAIGGLFGKKKSTPRYSSGVSTSYQDGEFASADLYRLSGFKKDAGGREGLSAAAKVFSETLSGLLGAFDINSSINTQLQFFKRKGAWGFASSTIDGVSAGSIGGDSVYSKDAQEAFNNLISQFLTTGVVNAIKVSKLPEGVKGLFDDLTDQTQISNMIAASVNLASHQDALASTYNLNADLAGKVATASGLAGDSLIAFVNALTTASMSQKSAASVLLKERAALTDLTGAVPTTLKAFDDWLKSINTTTTEGQAKFAEMFGARDRVSSLASAFDSITTARDNALYGLLSQSEQMAISQAKLRDAFAEVNAEVPGSRDELVKWVNGLDLTTEAGLKAAMAVPALVDAFQQIEDNANSTTNALRDMSRFTNLADYRFYKGVANNYGNVVANDYVKASGVIQSNSNGKSTVNGADVDVLAELKQMRQASQEQASLLNRILKVGLKVQA